MSERIIFALGQSAVYFFRSSGSSLFYRVSCSIFNRKNVKSVVFIDQGRVVRKPVNANPGLKVNQIINFSSIEMFLTDDILCSLRLL